MRSRRAWHKPPGELKRMMKFGTFFAYWTHEWSGDYRYYAKKIKDCGFDDMEISAGDILTMSDREIAGLRSFTEDLGLLISCNIGPAKENDVASRDSAVREHGIAYFTEMMKQMVKLGSDTLIGAMYTYWPFDFEDLDKEGLWARGVESFKVLGSRADDLGIKLCLEVLNRYESNILNTAEEGIRYCRDVDRKSVKLLLDTYHMNIEEKDVPGAFRMAGDLLGHVHIGENDRSLPGMGHQPWGEIGQALRDIHYEGMCVMEPFMQTGGRVGEDVKVWRDLTGGADEAEMDRNIASSLMYLKKQFLG